MSEDKSDKAGVILPPPVIYPAGLLLGAGLGWLRPLRLSDLVGPGWLSWAGWPPILLGLVFLVPAVWQFRRVGTSLPTHTPTTALATGGIYRFSRNPIYIGLSLCYAGIALLANSGWILALLLPILLLIHYGVILREERYLERKFGAAYLRYMAEVRRWL